ncbi:MAG: ABC transporter ATP-binding protein [Lachnospirales bacterium]
MSSENVQSTNNEKEILLQVKGLKQHFGTGSKFKVKAVDDITFDIYKGETFGLVGESGSGKSTTGRSIIRLYNPTAGEVYFKGEKITGKLSADRTKLLRQKMQMIFQDPMASLNPRLKVINIICEGLDIHFPELSKEEREQKAIDLLELVGLNREHLGRYPHEFSGGQRQRIGIARALITNPDFIIADEPISALDVSMQAQVVNLMKELQHKFGLTYLFIAHDLSMVRSISDRVAVMHLGHIVEIGESEEIFLNPQHDYTKSLISAIPHPDPISEKTRQRILYNAKQKDYENCEVKKISESHFVLVKK